MPDIYNNLLAPEWRTAISPVGLSDGVLQCIRTLTSRLGGLTNASAALKRVRPYYQTCYVKITDIIANNGKFDILLPVPEIDFFGNGLNTIAIRGRDFTYKAGVYTFNTHPSAFGTVAVQGRDTVLELVYTGGDYNWNQSPDAVAYQGIVDTPAVNAIEESLYSSAPMGITHSLPEAVGGCKLTGNQLQAVWEEDELLIGIDSEGSLVYAPKDTGVTFQVGEVPNTSELFNHFDIFILPLDTVTYIVPIGQNNVFDYPEIIERWPNITTDGLTFLGAELLGHLVQCGCVFYWWKYIKGDAARQRGLSQYLTNPGKVVTTTRVNVKTTVTMESQPVPQYGNFVLSTRCRVYNFN